MLLGTSILVWQPWGRTFRDYDLEFTRTEELLRRKGSGLRKWCLLWEWKVHDVDVMFDGDSEWTPMVFFKDTWITEFFIYE